MLAGTTFLTVPKIISLPFFSASIRTISSVDLRADSWRLYSWLVIVFVFIFFFAENIPGIFSKDTAVALETPNALRYVFAALPIIGIQLIGAAYFQAIGKALPALLLTLSRQGLFFIPLLFILPNFYGVMGVWIAFPVADIFSTLMTAYFLNREIRKQLVA